MEKILQNPTFWIVTVGIICVVSMIKWLWNFNKYILGIVVVLCIGLGVLYSQPGWLQKLWGSFN